MTWSHSGLRPSAQRREPCSNAGPYFPSRVLAELCRPVVEEIGTEAAADLCRISPRTLSRVLSCENRGGRTSWDVAERLVCGLLDDPSLFWSVPELAAVYAAAP